MGPTPSDDHGGEDEDDDQKEEPRHGQGDVVAAGGDVAVPLGRAGDVDAGGQQPDGAEAVDGFGDLDRSTGEELGERPGLEGLLAEPEQPLDLGGGGGADPHVAGVDDPVADRAGGGDTEAEAGAGARGEARPRRRPGRLRRGP